MQFSHGNVKVYQKYNPVYLNQLFPEFIAQSTASPSDGNVSLGIYCDKLGVVLICALQHFRKEKLSIAPKKAKVLLLSNCALLELDNEWSKQNLSWSEFGFVVSHLVDDDILHISQQNFFVTMFLL